MLSMLSPTSLLLLRSLLEKQEKANPNQRPPHKRLIQIIKVHMSGKRRWGRISAVSVLGYGSLGQFLSLLCFTTRLFIEGKAAKIIDFKNLLYLGNDITTKF